MLQSRLKLIRHCLRWLLRPVNLKNWATKIWFTLKILTMTRLTPTPIQRMNWKPLRTQPSAARRTETCSTMECDLSQNLWLNRRLITKKLQRCQQTPLKSRRLKHLRRQSSFTKMRGRKPKQPVVHKPSRTLKTRMSTIRTSISTVLIKPLSEQGWVLTDSALPATIAKPLKWYNI